MEDYLTLFETEGWEEHVVPVDPILLKPIVGTVGAVMAHWELTDTEKSILEMTL
jgi:hypothetical protein